MTAPMKILFTGASSFTGFWFVKSLAAAGHEVICPLRGALERYDGVRRQRVEKLQSHCRLVPEVAFGTDAFLKLIRDGGKWDLLCHHATEAANYQRADFDVHRALENNTLNLRDVLAVLKSGGLKGVIQTGSAFENDEGVGEEPLRAFSPYGLSKGLTWQMIRYYCGDARLPLGKFVIPNAIGPFEEPRFTAYLMRTWKEGKPAGVKTPDYVRDNIHVDLLTAVYLKFVERVVALREGLVRINPSGYVEKQGDFARRLAREMKARLGWACDLELQRQEDFSEPLRRVNIEPAAPSISAWNESAAWDAFANFYVPK